MGLWWHWDKYKLPSGKTIHDVLNLIATNPPDNLTGLGYIAVATASDVHATWFRKALDAGVRMALGSDIRPLKDAALLEMGLWVRDGATPWLTLVAATRNGADLCGVGGELGTVEVGKLADLIAVGANPLEDITNVRHLQLVLKEGRIVSDKRHPSSAPLDRGTH